MSQTIPLGTPEARAELDSLQSKLADRLSTIHFAHSAVSMVVALILAGASGKLFWDARHFPWAGIAVAVSSIGFAGYSLVRYKLGMRHLKKELSLFASLQELRRSLRLDDPAALLPQVQ